MLKALSFSARITAFCRAVGVAVAVCLTSHAQASGEASPPNVILIVADDMGAGDLSVLNGGLNRTPNLNRLRSESVWFDQAYSASPVCAPARAALLTGRYPHRTGAVTLNMENYPELTRIRGDEVTMADVFQSHGYTTGLVGKWHSGMGPDYHPRWRGFDEFEGFVSARMVPSYFDYTLDLAGQIQAFNDSYLTTELSRRAVEFVRRHQDRPFFLHLAHYAPHRPLDAPPERIQPYLDRGFDQDTATVYAMIEIMDEGIGDLLAELDRLELSDHTIVIFTSDNGPDPLVSPRFNRDLRGTKYMVYEGGIRVPFMIRWPSHYSPGERRELIHFTDVLPTLIELCQMEPPPHVFFDGVSVGPVLHQNPADLPAARFWQWNRHLPRYSHNAAMREGPWKLVRPYRTRDIPAAESTHPPALYHLADDPGETQDVAADHPQRVARMDESLTTWSRKVERDRTRANLFERPGVVVDHQTKEDRLYIGSPGLAILPSGAYLAKSDEFGPGSSKDSFGITRLYRSDDRGETWTRLPNVEGLSWASLFVHRGDVYLLGTTHAYGHAVIRKSTDEGQSWTRPLDEHSGLLRSDGRFHTAPGPVVIHEGRIWRAMEDAMGLPDRWGAHFRAFMMSAPVDADLLQASSWRSSPPQHRDDSWLEGHFRGWLEGNAVVAPDGEIKNILRVDYRLGGGKAAMIHIGDDGERTHFDPGRDIIDFPGGCKKFTIRFDPRTQRYWSLTNWVAPVNAGGNPERTRNTVALISSSDLRTWKIHAVLLHHPDISKHGFQYLDWHFDGEDLIALSRTAFDDEAGGADNQHNANFITFHRFENFRNLGPDDSIVAPEQLGWHP